jgi:hypothetical protein
MMEELTQEDAKAILLRLRQKIPPEKISPLFVKTRAAKEVLDRAHRSLRTISKQGGRDFLIMNATRGAGKTAIIQYLKEQLQGEVFFVYQEKSSTSAEDLFRYFVNRTGREVITDAVRDLSADPLEVYGVLSERGDNGTAIALAGLLEDSADAWNWLCTSSSILPKLKCGLKLVKNVREKNALDALATLVKLLTYQKPVVFAIDELEGAFNELTNRQKGKLRSLLVDLINHTGFSRILFLFAATDHVYEKCFMKPEADAMGLKRRVENATGILGLPTREEARKILERVLHLYSLAHGFQFSSADIRQIRQKYDAPSTMPSDIIWYAFKKADDKWEFVRKYKEITERLEAESKKIARKLGPAVLGRKFEEAVGIVLRFLPGAEYHIPHIDATTEGDWLTREVRGLKKVHKLLDWSFRLDAMSFWIEVCNTKKKDSVIPSEKSLAVFAKTLYHEGSAGLFIAHNFNRIGVGRGTGKVIARYPELMKRVGILNLDEWQFKLLIGILGIEEEDRRYAAQFLFEKIGLDQIIEDLRSGTHFFW